jgi:hypothetical protein
MKRIIQSLMLSSLFVLLATHAALAKDGSATPRSAVPDALVGYWLGGSTSIGNFWGYDGSYKGAAYEVATGYAFQKNGNAKQYFYYTNTSYYCRTQVLGYREGTVVFDTKNNTFQFYATSGWYRNYNSCGQSTSPGFGEKKPYTSKDLYPAKQFAYDNWNLVAEGGKTIWRIKMSDGTNLDYEKSTEPQKQ